MAKHILDTVITDQFGMPYPDEVYLNRRRLVEQMTGKPAEKFDEDVTPRRAVVNALIAMFSQEDPIEEKYRRGELAARFGAIRDIEITPAEKDLVVSQVGKFYGPAIVYPTLKALETIVKPEDLPVIPDMAEIVPND